MEMEMCEREHVRRQRTRTREREYYERDFQEPPKTQTWKSATVDCMKVFTQALLLMPELQRPRTQLQDLLEKVIREELNSDLSLVLERVRVRYENETRREELQVERVQAHREFPDIFVYGRDSARIDLVVQDVLKETVVPVQEFATIKLQGRQQLGNLSIDGYQAILAAKLRLQRIRHVSTIFILLEEFTPSLFLAFQRSSLLKTQRLEGIRISVICWSTTYFHSDDIRILRQLTRKVFVPSSGSDADEVENGRGMENLDMPVHKTATLRTPAPAEPIYASVARKSAREEKGPIVVNDKLVGSSADIKPMRKPSSNPIPDSGASASREDAAVGQPETPANGNRNPDGHDIFINAGGDNDSVTYSKMQPVRKQPAPSTPIFVEPKSDEKPTVSARWRVWWNKKESDCVAIDSGRDDVSERDQDGICGTMASCFISTYACIFD